jgi:hypothetical protein
MNRRWTLAAIVLACIAATAVFAASTATIVLKSGQRETGTLVYNHDNNMNLKVNGQEKSFPQSDIAVIEFAGDPNSSELAKLPTGNSELERNTIVLRDGQVIHGKLYDIKGDTVTVNVTSSDRRDFNMSNIARIYMNHEAARSVFNASSSTGAVATTGQAGGTVQVQGNRQWTDTGITVRKGDRVAFQSSGEINFGSSGDMKAGPDGQGSFTGSHGSYPVPQMPVGGLIGRVGNSAPFPIGSNSQAITMPANGRLFLGINDDRVDDNSGAFSVTIVRQ